MTGERMTAEQVTRRLARVRVGIREDAAPWMLDLRPGCHVLVTGTTGAGKSGLIWSALWALADVIRAGWVKVDAVDPKVVELRNVARTGLGTVCTRVAEMPTQLEALVAEMDGRCDRMDGRDHVPSLAEPIRIVIIDELATLTALADSKARNRVEAALGALLQRGRAAGYTIIITSVEVTKEVVRWRALTDTRVCYRTREPVADLVFGDGAHDRGIRTQDIPRSMPGVAYADTDTGITRVRTLHITDVHLDVLAIAHAAQASVKEAAA